MFTKRFAFAVPLAALVAVPAPAITINLVKAPNNLTDNPSYDSNLNKLGNIMQAAADYWEAIFPQNHDVTIEYGYLDLDPAILGVASLKDVNENTGRPVAGAIALDSTVNSQIYGDIDRDWYFDLTPSDNSEFDMQQTLVRDLTPQQRSAYYNGSPPELLEAGYYGNYKGADLGDDAFSVALHEIGHILGVNDGFPDSSTELADNDYDFYPSWVHNASVAAEVWDLPGDVQKEHLRSPESLMAVGAGSGDRHLPGATDIFAAAQMANWTSVDLYRMDFLGGTSWNVGTNWEGGSVPDSNDDAYVRHGGDVDVHADAVAGYLTIRDGSSVNTNDNELDVTNKVAVEAGPDGDEATLIVEPNGSLIAHELEINDGGNVAVSGSTVLPRVNAQMVDINPDGVLFGHGRVSALHLYNNGTITALNPLGDNTTYLRLYAKPGGSIDLDGNSELATEPGQNLGIEGSGRVFAVLGNVRVNGALSDAFDGEMTIGANRSVHFSQPWQLGDNVALTSPDVYLNGGSTEPEAAAIDGANMTAHAGQIHVDGFGSLRSHVTFESSVEVNVASNSYLLIDDGATFRGGSFQGPGTMRFDTDVLVDTSTTIDLASVDLDGDTGGPGTHLTIDGGTLRLNTQRIDSPGAPNRYDGVMDLNGRFSELDVRLQGSNTSWQMNGVMNLNGSPLPGTMLDGSDVHVTGTMNVDGHSWVAANLDVDGTIALNDASTELGLLQGPHVVRAGASVTGAGLIDVRNQGLLRLEDNATVNVDVENRGRLEAGTPVGVANIDGDLTQASSVAEIGIELGGLTVGDDYDRLAVDGTATLAGTLDVDLTDAGNGFFVPEEDDVFTVLTATGGLVGEFDNYDLPTHLGGLLLDWDVLYLRTMVALQLDEIGGLLGDYNYNGRVEGGDMLYWQQTFGSTDDLSADGNLDGVVDDLDLQVWSDNFGAVASTMAAIASVPEPSTLAMGLIACCLAISGSRRSQHVHQCAARGC